MNEKMINEIINLIDNSDYIGWSDDLIKIRAKIKEVLAIKGNIDAAMYFLYDYIFFESIKIVSAIKHDESMQLIQKILKEYFDSKKDWDDIENLYFIWQRLKKCENCTMECDKKKDSLIITKG